MFCFILQNKEEMANKIVNLIRLFRYKEKYYIPRRSTAEFMQEFEDMELREDDIFVCTYPKSGKCLAVGGS